MRQFCLTKLTRCTLLMWGGLIAGGCASTPPATPDAHLQAGLHEAAGRMQPSNYLEQRNATNHPNGSGNADYQTGAASLPSNSGKPLRLSSTKPAKRCWVTYSPMAASPAPQIPR
jgi:hypothetical protein